MKILDLKQGSPEWKAARLKFHCASEAPVMMGASKHMKRDELLHLKKTGGEREFSDWEQKYLLDKGHQVEWQARKLVEAELGEDLFPVTVTDDAGRMLASMDGLTMDGETIYEHKLWNAELAAAIRSGATEFPNGLEWQLEHQLLTSAAKRVIFICSDGTAENKAEMEYTPQPGRAQKLLAGWNQFDEDLANYQHVEVLPPAVGKALMALPALAVSVEGKVTSSNLAVYRAEASRFIQSIKTDLQTDQDFADAENTIKFCADSEGTLTTVKQQALSQTASIDELFRTIDLLKEEMRQKRLELEKLVKARKETIREEIRQVAVAAFAAHVAKLNERIGKPYMPHIVPDFATPMKGKKTIASLRDAVNTELASQKIAANEIADRIEINVKQLDKAWEFAFLFADASMIVQKQPEDLALLISSRIVEHKERERVKAEQAAQQKVAPQATAVTAAGTGLSPLSPVPPVGATPYEQGYAILQDFAERFSKVKEFKQVITEINRLKPAKQRRAA